ncbi:MAG: calcium-binding protein [bacterium]|nr:calcium-binding protein [bacterium]
MKRLASALLLAASVLVVAPAASTADVPTCLGLPATIIGTSGNDLIRATAGTHVIVGLEGDDNITGHDGDDVICGGAGNDQINGAGGDDRISGGPGDDYISGFSGDDILRGGAGDDAIQGNDGDDLIDGGSGADTLEGSSGNDTIRGRTGADLIGGDYLSSHFEPGGDLKSGSDVILGGRGPDLIWAGGGNDRISGGRGEDTAYGQDGDDTMLGGPRDDALYGGPGSDIARGRAGVDSCSAEVISCENSIPEVAPVAIRTQGGELSLRGVVNHTEPLVAVDFALKGRDGLWLQTDGSLGVHRVWHTATLSPAAATTTDWSATISVARSGHFSLSVRAIDADADIGRVRPRPHFDIGRAGLQIGVIVDGGMWDFDGLKFLPPGTRLGRNPRQNMGNPIPSGGTGPTVRMSGSAHDVGEFSISAVEVAVRDVATGLWLQEDGAFGPAIKRHLADCPHCVGTPSIYWLFDAELPDGDYELVGFGIGSRTELVEDVRWRFTVDGSVAETPQVAVDQPAGSQFTPDSVAFTGSASDNLGVGLVRVSIRDRDTGLWLQGRQHDGTLLWESYKRAFRAQLSDKNEPATDWEYGLELEPGRYDLSVVVFDEVLHRNSIKPWLPFEVVAP